jgi:hypothetical protein
MVQFNYVKFYTFRSIENIQQHRVVYLPFKNSYG